MLHPVLCIDYGSARIGLAITDPVGIMAHPLETIHCKDVNPLLRIAELIEQRQVKQLVVGLPYHLDGREGDAAEKVYGFVKRLQEHIPQLPIHYCDERLSTVAAANKLRQAGKKAKSHKNIIDQAAAVEILNDWLTSQDTSYELPPEGF
ncbi:Holliday junction resolvase RuvX [Persicirhabdus sediminis]|nr:Holliday junction resolvase RuvX [Persicirhabdus sediminis]